MKIANPKIQQIISDLFTLSTFAAAAAQSAAQPIEAPMAFAASALTDDLVLAYATDEQADRGALYRSAVGKMKAKVAELEALEVAVTTDPKDPPPPPPPPDDGPYEPVR